MKPDKEYEAQLAFLRTLIMFAKPSILTEGTIFDVDTTKFICTVLMSDGFTKYGNVPLKVLIGSQATILEIPKVGTDCLLRFKDNSLQRPQLESVHEVETYKWLNGTSGLQFDINGFILSVDKTNLTITKDGVKVENGSYGLKKTLTDLLTALQNLTVTTGTGPSGVPINSPQIKQVQTDLDKYLI